MARPLVVPSTSADLAALLATEQRLENRLAEARAEADRLRAEARERAARAEADADALSTVAVARVAEEGAAEARARVAAVEAEADREIARWDSLSGEALAPAVAEVLAAVRARLGGAP